MDSSHINLSTGPVSVRQKVKEAFLKRERSHRTPQFQEQYDQVCDRICKALKVKECTILTGSGTLANEVMIQEINKLQSHGIILSNGEFGDRLIRQARKINLSFDSLQLEWGAALNDELLEKHISTDKHQWILACHCETSTGMMQHIESLCKFDVPVFLDCMSSVGTFNYDLSGLAMATASSGKGIASFAGLGLVLSNRSIGESQNNIPTYLDLGVYRQAKSIPFTISSNMIDALEIALENRFSNRHIQELREKVAIIYKGLKPLNVLPFAKGNAVVFTLKVPDGIHDSLITKLEEANITLSYQSSYLQQRKWIQIALFGDHSLAQIQRTTNRIKDLLTSA